MATATEIFRTIEEQFDTYLEGVIGQLTRESSDAMSTEKVHTLRGQAVASKRLVRQLRNTLGYDASNL